GVGPARARAVGEEGDGHDAVRHRPRAADRSLDCRGQERRHRGSAPGRRGRLRVGRGPHAVRRYCPRPAEHDGRGAARSADGIGRPRAVGAGPAAVSREAVVSDGLIKILDGNTFVVSDDCGDIDASLTDPTGLFSYDTRFLSKWALTV